MKSFLALLVFLYTDTVPTNMTVSDYRELLVLADRFCLPRLISVCEGAIVERISSEIKKKRLNTAQCNDVINLLLTGQVGVIILCASQIYYILILWVNKEQKKNQWPYECFQTTSEYFQRLLKISEDNLRLLKTFAEYRKMFQSYVQQI